MTPSPTATAGPTADAAASRTTAATAAASTAAARPRRGRRVIGPAALAGRPSGRRVATVTVATGSSAYGVPMAQRSRAPSRSPARRSMVAFSASNCSSGGGA